MADPWNLAIRLIGIELLQLEQIEVGLGPRSKIGWPSRLDLERAAHKVAVDTNTAINAAHIACDQIADGESPSMVDAIVSQQFPTIGADEYWITAGARKAY